MSHFENLLITEIGFFLLIGAVLSIGALISAVIMYIVCPSFRKEILEDFRR